MHTGLGKSGQDTLLVSPEFAAHARDVFPNSKVEADGDKGGVSSGYNLARGFVHDLYRHRFPSDPDSLFVTQEFGTVKGILVARALVLENMAHHYIHDTAGRSPWTQLTKDAFYLSGDAAWKRSVVKRGLAVLAALIESRHALVLNR